MRYGYDFPPSWLALLVLDGVMHLMQENLQQCFLAAGPVCNNMHWCNHGKSVTGVTKHFLIGFDLRPLPGEEIHIWMWLGRS